jgi:citrate synthase
MEILRTGVSALSSFDPDATDNSREASVRKAIRLTAQMPTLVAAWERIRRGKPLMAPNPKLSLAANFLYMMTGKKPTDLAAKTFDIALILHADHEFNASTFAARVTAATLSDMHSAVVSGIGALKGPLHGGANEQVMLMVDKIKSPADAESFVRTHLADKGFRIMGFGHRVYRAEDPRARLLRRTAEELGSPRVGAAKALEEAALAALQIRHPERVLATNVEYWAAVVLDVADIPAKLTPAMFACARVAGWSAHILEQKRAARLIRPSARYTGPGPRPLTSLQ